MAAKKCPKCGSDKTHKLLDLRSAKGDTSGLPHFSIAGWRECRDCKCVWETRVPSWACWAGMIAGIAWSVGVGAVFVLMPNGANPLTFAIVAIGLVVAWGSFRALRRLQDPPRTATGESGKLLDI